MERLFLLHDAEQGGNMNMNSLDGIITLIIFLLLFGRFILPKLAYLAGKIVQRIMLSTKRLIRCPDCGSICSA